VELLLDSITFEDDVAVVVVDDASGDVMDGVAVVVGVIVAAFAVLDTDVDRSGIDSAFPAATVSGSFLPVLLLLLSIFIATIVLLLLLTERTDLRTCRAPLLEGVGDIVKSEDMFDSFTTDTHTCTL
jgi:hypothetical protein